MANSEDYKIPMPPPENVEWNSRFDDNIRKEFIASCKTGMADLEELALLVERAGAGDDVPEAWGNIRSILHSLKGECGFIGLADVASVCHETETALDIFEPKGQCPTDILLEVKDWILKVVLRDEYVATVTDEIEPQESVKHPSVKPVDGLKILIVDDDFTCRIFLQEVLKDYGDVHIATDGSEALEVFMIALESGNSYDLVCLDIMMPGMDGQEALSCIRKAEEKRGVTSTHGAKIVMTTALDDIKNVSRAFQGLCDDYLTKPIKKTDVLDKLKLLGLI